MTSRIWDLAERTGVNASTIRYYERRGVLPLPQRSSDGQNLYGTVDLARVRFVRFGRGLRLELDEIRALIEMIGEGNCEEIDAFGQAIFERVAQMHRFCESLRSVTAAVQVGELDETGAFEKLAGGWDEQGSADGSAAERDGSDAPLSSQPSKRKRARS